MLFRAPHHGGVFSYHFTTLAQGREGCRSWKAEFYILFSSFFFPSIFFVAFLDQNHVSTWSGWIYTYKALRWRSLRRKFFFSLLHCWGGKTRGNKCLGRARMVVQSVYILRIYIPLHIFVTRGFFFLCFLYNLWKKDEGWIGSNASTVEPNWVAQRLFFFRGLIGSFFVLFSLFFFLHHCYKVYGN